MRQPLTITTDAIKHIRLQCARCGKWRFAEIDPRWIIALCDEVEGRNKAQETCQKNLTQELHSTSSTGPESVSQNQTSNQLPTASSPDSLQSYE